MGLPHPVRSAMAVSSPNHGWSALRTRVAVVVSQEGALR